MKCLPRWVRLPTQAEAVKLADDTHLLSGFPRIAPLSVDGTYVKCVVPKYLKRACFNRKKFHSLNVMVVAGKYFLKDGFTFFFTDPNLRHNLT